MSVSLESQIITVINEEGPLLGKELMEQIETDDFFAVWQACFNSGFLQISHFARYYLRYDITRKDFIRLSPSILRDFLSFTIFSLPHQRQSVIDRQVLLSNSHRDISVRKLGVATDAFLQLPEEDRAFLQQNSCSFISGDIAYFLAHDEPRESNNLGKMVKGSDIDIITVYRDDIDEARLKTIEETFLKNKYIILKMTGYSEELDFIFKPASKMKSQFAYSDIHEMIASKILYESVFLHGSIELYMELKNDLESMGTKTKIEADFEAALTSRKNSMNTLLDNKSGILDENLKSLFFFSQERIEFT